MNEESRWSIAELQARYELEPQLADFFVEGTLDREILAQAGTRLSTRPAIYEIDVVDVPMTVLAKHGLSSGNKQRVIALSRELDLLPMEAKVSCLVDRDLDHWFGELMRLRRLRWSVYSSIECHFIDPNTVSDIVLTTARSKIRKLEPYLASLLEILRQLFALRLADRELQLSLKWVALRRYLSKRGDTVAFDLQKYTIALLTSNRKSSQQAEFAASCQAWRETLNCDIRLCVRGHDFTELLAWTISEFGGQKEFASEAAVERLFVLLARSVSSIASELHERSET